MSIKKIMFGGGCFWCTEAVFNMIKGIISVIPGYSGGKTDNPTYEEVCNGNTEHAEVIQIKYDENKIDLQTLLDIFFEMHDPTTLNKQGADYGTQYRSVIFYYDETQKDIIYNNIEKLQKELDKKIVTDVSRAKEFYPAEEYHRGYYKNNSDQPYCDVIITPKLQKIKKEFKKELK